MGTNGALAINAHRADLELLWMLWLSENTGEVHGYICIAFSMTWISVLQSASASSMCGGLWNKIWEQGAALKFSHSALAGESGVQVIAQVFGFFFATQDDEATQSIVGEDIENSRSDCTSLLCSISSLCPAPVLFTGEGPLHPSSASICREYKLSHPSNAETWPLQPELSPHMFSFYKSLAWSLICYEGRSLPKQGGTQHEKHVLSVTLHTEWHVVSRSWAKKRQSLSIRKKDQKLIKK